MRFQFKDAKKEEVLRLKDFVGEITLGEDGLAPAVSSVQILRAGAFAHPFYGEMLISPQVLSDMVKNFDNRVRRQDLPVDYFHESDKEAAGWFTKLFTENNGQELWGEVKWTPKAQQMLGEKSVRYFSADFAFEWTDPESGVSYKNVLFGGGLVNRPFVKDMQPVVELSEGNQMKTVEQLQTEIAQLKEVHASESKKLSDELAETKGKLALSEKSLKEAKEAADQAAKEAKFAELCSKGKACAAQKDAYMAGDFAKFAELAQPVNVQESGAEGDSEEGDDAEEIELDEEKPAKGKKVKLYELSPEEKRICSRLKLSHAEFCEANPKSKK